MRIIAKRTLRQFWKKSEYTDAEQPLRAWFAEAEQASWQRPNEIKAQYKHASIVGSNRVVFNIAGNKYRLVVAVNYDFQTIYIRFVGTHQEYDQINVQQI